MKKIKKLRTGPPPEKVGWTYFCTNLFDIIIKICHNCYMKLLKIDLEDAKPEDYTSTSLFFTKASEAEKIHYHNASRKQNYHNYRLTSYRLKKCAFTLAEVLITLGIIGVVAAMTLPTLIQKHQEKELAVRVRKIYSDINNALLMSQKDSDGNIDFSTVFNPDNTNYETAQAFAKYFNGSKVCKNSGQCQNAYHKLKYAKYYTLGTGQGAETTLGSYPIIILNNGAMLYIQQYNNPDCYGMNSYEQTDENGDPVYDGDKNPVVITSENTMCGYIYIDVNGVKKPNRFGQDAYRIGITKTRVLPNAQPYQGRESLKNILTGNDKFVYEDYTVGESKEQE